MQMEFWIPAAVWFPWLVPRLHVIWSSSLHWDWIFNVFTTSLLNLGDCEDCDSLHALKGLTLKWYIATMYKEL